MRSIKENPFTYGIILWAIFITVVLLAKWPSANVEESAVEEPQEATVICMAEPVEMVQSSPAPVYQHIAQTITPYEKGLLAMVVYREARGEPADGQAAVVEVVLNRVVSDKFPDNIEDVIYQKDPVQFSTASSLTTVPVTELACLTTAYDIVDGVLTETEPVLPSPYLFFNTTQPRKSDHVAIGAHYFS